MEARLGIRDATEAYANGIRSTDVDSYFYSDILFNFNGPMNLNSKATMETISLYRTLRGRKIDRLEMDILKIIMDYPKTEEEVLINVQGSHDRAVASIKDLWNRSIICKDSDSKFRYVVEKFELKESATILETKILESYGFIDFQLFSEITGNRDEQLYSVTIENVRKRDGLKNCIILDNKRAVLVNERFLDMKKKSTKPFIIGPRDLFSYIFRNQIKNQTGGTRNFLLIDNLSVKAFATVKRNRNELKIDEMSGEKELRKEFIKEFSNSGYSIRF
jgi:ATP-dependent Lhr-like helicase